MAGSNTGTIFQITTWGDDLLQKKRPKCVDFCRMQCYYKQAVADAAAQKEEK